MIKHILAISFGLLFLINANAQYGESIRSGRPGQAIGPFTVGAYVFQNQSGYEFSNYEINTLQSGKTNYGESIFRYGLTEHFELGAGISYQNAKSSFNQQENTLQGLSGLSFRMRSNVHEGNGLIPSVGYQININLPWESESFKSEIITPKIMVVTGQNLTDKLGLTTNFGIDWSNPSSDPSGFYILNLGYSVNTRFSIFIENYGNFGAPINESKLDGGFAFLANNDLQFDLFLGYHQNEFIQSEWFVNTGISWRFRAK